MEKVKNLVSRAINSKAMNYEVSEQTRLYILAGIVALASAALVWATPDSPSKVTAKISSPAPRGLM